MDSDDVVPTSDNEELEAALAETDLLESFKAASEKIKQGFASYRETLDNLNSARRVTPRPEGRASETPEVTAARERQNGEGSPPRKRLKPYNSNSRLNSSSESLTQSEGPPLLDDTTNSSAIAILQPISANSSPTGDIRPLTPDEAPGIVSSLTRLDRKDVIFTRHLPMSDPQDLSVTSVTPMKRKLSRLTSQTGPRQPVAPELSPHIPPALNARATSDAPVPETWPSEFLITNDFPRSPPDDLADANAPFEATVMSVLTQSRASAPSTPPPIASPRRTFILDTASPAPRRPPSRTESLEHDQVQSSPLTPAQSPEPPRRVVSPIPAAVDDGLAFEEDLGGRYSLRQRKRHQLNPYKYDSLVYKQTMRANPDAIVSVLSPSRRRRGSPKRHEGEPESGSDAEVDMGAEEDPEEDRFWKRHEKRREAEQRQDGHSRSKSKEPDHRRADPLTTRPREHPSPNAVPAFYNDTFSDDDDIPIAGPSRPKVPGQNEKGKEKTVRKRLKPFPIRAKDLLELRAREDGTAANDQEHGDLGFGMNAPVTSLPVFQASLDRRSGRNEDVISIPSDHSESRVPSPVPDEMIWDIATEPIVPLEPLSEFDVPPTSSGPGTSQSRSAKHSDASDDDVPGHRDSGEQSSSADSDDEDITEAERRRRRQDKKREKALRHMMPAVAIKKLAQPGNRSREQRNRRAVHDDSEEDQPLQPGQTRVRKGLHRTRSEIKGDSESSDDVEMTDRMDDPTRPDVPAFRSDSEYSSVSRGIDAQYHRRREPNTVMSLITSSESDSSDEQEDMEQTLGRWISPPASQRFAGNRNEIREGDLINRMLSRTRLSGPKKKKTVSRRPAMSRADGASSSKGGQHNGGGRRTSKSTTAGRVNINTHGVRSDRQTRLPFRRQQSTSSRASTSLFSERLDRHSEDLPVPDLEQDTVPHEYQIQDGHVVPKVLTIKERKKAAKRHGIHTFGNPTRQIPVGHDRPSAFSVEIEHETVQRSILEFTRRDRDHHKQPSNPQHKAQPRLPKERGVGPSYQVPDRDLSSPADLGVHTLPSGLLFEQHTYLGQGWLQELLFVVSGVDRLEDARLPPITLFDFYISSTPSLEDFVATVNQVYDKLLSIARDPDTKLVFQDLQSWRRLLRCICQHVSVFFAQSEASLGQLPLCLANQLRRVSTLVDENYAVRPDESPTNYLVLEAQWFAVELSMRCHKHPLMVGDYAQPWFHITRLLKHLWAYGLNRPRNVVIAGSDEGLDYSNPHLRIAEIWICLIHLLQRDNPLVGDFWKVLLEVVKDPKTRPPATMDLRSTEFVWVGLFGLVALSQFSDRGVSGTSFRLPACWELVMEALERVQFMEQQASGSASQPSKKRDRYIRLVFARCMNLRKTWQWRLIDSPQIFPLFRRLFDVFKDRKFSNLSTEESDFPTFLLDYDMELLSQVHNKDTAFALFLKLIVQTSQDTELGARDVRLTKILAITVPVAAISVNKDVNPTKSELSRLYNRFSALAVAIFLLPSKDAVQERLTTARRYVKFSDADWETRRACIRGLQHLAILVKYLQLPLDTLLEWLAEMTVVAISECTENMKSQAGATLTRSWSILNVQMILGCVTSIIKVDMKQPEGQHRPAQYPDPALLQGPWVTQIFTATVLTTVPTTSEAICSMVQAFLDARAVIVPPPQRSRTVVVEDDSQQEYAQDDAFFEDPAVIAAMDNIVGNSDIADKEATVCRALEAHIAPAIFRLMCGQFEVGSSDPASFEGWCSGISVWVECWVSCASVLVQNKKRDWSSFLDYGAQSWERTNISDLARKQHIALCFMFRMLQHDPTAYASPAYQDRFLEVLFHSLIAKRPTLEPDYVGLIFSIDGLRHTLLQDLPNCERENQYADFDVSTTQFLEHRCAWLQHIISRIADNLAIASWDPKLDNQCQIWIGFLGSMLSIMQHTLERLDPSSTEAQQYRQLCTTVADIFSAFPTVRNRPRLEVGIRWLQTIV